MYKTFLEFVQMCFLLIAPGLADQFNDDRVRFVGLFGEFFKFVSEHTTDFHKTSSSLRDEMVENFRIFYEFASNDIDIQDIDTFCTKMKIRIEKFMVAYEEMYSFNRDEEYETRIGVDDDGNTFMTRPHFNDVITEMRYTIDEMCSDFDFVEDNSQKVMNNKVRSNKIEGNRSDYALYLVKKKNSTSRSYKGCKERKNKRFLDYPVDVIA
jgi:hypothetical protein